MKKTDKLILGHLTIPPHEFTIEAAPAGNGESTVKFVKNLQQKYPNQKIVLIWDGASYHRFGEFREYLTEVNQSKSPDHLEVTCILCAPNAPQLLGSVARSGSPTAPTPQNPVEDIWLQAKNFLRKYWYLCKSFWAIKKLFELFYDSSKFDFTKIHQDHFSQ